MLRGLDGFLFDLVVLVAMILQSILVLEGLHADVASEAGRVVVVDREMLGEARRKRKTFCADRALVGLVIVVQLVILQAVFALEALVALLALIDLVVVHDLVLLEADQGREDFVADAADLRGAGRVLVLVILEPILTFKLLVALKMKSSVSWRLNCVESCRLPDRNGISVPDAKSGAASSDGTGRSP